MEQREDGIEWRENYGLLGADGGDESKRTFPMTRGVSSGCGVGDCAEPDRVGGTEPVRRDFADFSVQEENRNGNPTAKTAAAESRVFSHIRRSLPARTGVAMLPSSASSYVIQTLPVWAERNSARSVSCMAERSCTWSWH